MKLINKLSTELHLLMGTSSDLKSAILAPNPPSYEVLVRTVRKGEIHVEREGKYSLSVPIVAREYVPDEGQDDLPRIKGVGYIVSRAAAEAFAQQGRYDDIFYISHPIGSEKAYISELCQFAKP